MHGNIVVQKFDNTQCVNMLFIRPLKMGTYYDNYEKPLSKQMGSGGGGVQEPCLDNNSNNWSRSCSSKGHDGLKLRSRGQLVGSTIIKCIK